MMLVNEWSIGFETHSVIQSAFKMANSNMDGHSGLCNAVWGNKTLQFNHSKWLNQYYKICTWNSQENIVIGSCWW